MRLKSLPTVLLSVILAGSVVMGTTSCATDPAPPPADPAASTDPSETPEEADATAGEDDATNCETNADRGSSLDPDSVPDGLPDGFPGIGVPFYSDATQIAAQGDTGDLFVLEYQAEHEPAKVNEFFADALLANCWEILDTSVEGSMTVHKAWIPGYSLVVAVGPDRTDNSKTGIHYTLRLQQTP